MKYIKEMFRRHRTRFLLYVSLIYIVINFLLFAINLSTQNIEKKTNPFSITLGDKRLETYIQKNVRNENVAKSIDRAWTFRYKSTFSLVKGVWLSMDFKDFYLPIDKKSVSDPLLNKHQYQIILNSDKCKDDDVFLIVFVHSAIDAFEKRQLIRSTYGSVERYRNKRLEYVFVVGQVANDTKHSALKNESLVYNDIIQGNFNDSYLSLTYKQLFGYFWISKYCSGASFVLKIDDDVLMNTKFVVDYLLLISYERKADEFLLCKYEIIQDLLRPIRNGSKWKQGRDEYPYDSQPPYCLGFASLMSIDIVSTILETSKVIPFYPFDDVYVGGFITWAAKITPFEPIPFLSDIWWPDSKVDNLNCTMFYSVQNVDGSYPFDIWKTIWKAVNNSKYCPQESTEWDLFLKDIELL